jgi:hypothetical protein
MHLNTKDADGSSSHVWHGADPFSKMATVVPFRSFLAYNNRPYRSFNSIACVAKAFGYTMERVLVLYAVLQCCPSLAHNNTLFYICMPEL